VAAPVLDGGWVSVVLVLGGGVLVVTVEVVLVVVLVGVVVVVDVNVVEVVDVVDEVVPAAFT
jgi:hypothetical protein